MLSLRYTFSPNTIELVGWLVALFQSKDALMEYICTINQ